MDRNTKVCYCMDVKVGDIIDKVNEGCTSFTEVRRQTGLGESCGRCKEHGRVVFEEIIGKSK